MVHTLVIGAGQAGAALVARLRAKGEEGPITLVGEEVVPPYQRPPLSKAYLLGEMPVERLPAPGKLLRRPGNRSAPRRACDRDRP